MSLRILGTKKNVAIMYARGFKDPGKHIQGYFSLFAPKDPRDQKNIALIYDQACHSKFLTALFEKQQF